MTPGSTPRSPLTYDEAEQVAITLIARWQGITGQNAHPSIEQVIDLVQRTLREAAVVVSERKDGAGEGQ